MLFKIHWRSLITGYEGQGKENINDSEPDKLVSDLNSKYPNVYHWYEK